MIGGSGGNQRGDLSADDFRLTIGVGRYVADFPVPFRALAISAAPDTTAPILSLASGTATGTTTADGDVTTDEANGTLYWVVTQSATTPSVAQVQAGQDHTGAAADASGSQAVSATGNQDVSATGLTAATTYYFHFQHQDAAANDSTVLSSASFATDAAGPTIDTQPQNTTVDENTLATFTVAATGTGTLTYQWQEDTGGGFANLTGETADTLDFIAVEGDNGYQYRCVVTDDNGSTNSNAATLTVTALTPTIDTQPQNATVFETQTASFTVAATASGGSLSYQWYDASDDSALVGETDATLQVTTVLGDNGNTYYVIVTDGNGSVQSNTVTLTVNATSVTFQRQPESASIMPGSSVTLDVWATDELGNAISYQWYDAADNSPIAGADRFRITLDEGITVYAIATDVLTGNTAQSNNATVTLLTSSFTDNTEAIAQTLPDPGSQVTTRQDWASLVASLEKSSVLVDDYDFSGRTFKRRDKLLNPRE